MCEFFAAVVKIHNTPSIRHQEMETKNNKLPQKRQRSENWLVEDKRILMDLVKERVNAIENKNTDSNTNAKKLAAWSDLCSSFNTMCSGGPRTLAQLKAQWGTIKMTKKKDKSIQRKQLFLTGGGPPPEMDPENDNDIYSWLPNEFIIDSNEFDSDQINQNKVVGSSPKKIKLDSSTKHNNEDIQVVQEIIIHHNTPDGNDQTTVKPQIVKNEENVMVQREVHEVEEINVIQDQNTPKISSKHTFIKRPSVSRQHLSKAPVKKKENEAMTNYAACIANTEVACRKELHSLQMENERKKSRNLDLKQELILKKIEFYKKKLLE